MKVSSLRTSRSARRRLVAGAGALALGAGVLGGVLAAPAQAVGSVTMKDIVLGVGSNETQRYVTWYASAATDSIVQLEKTAELNAGAFDEDVMNYPATVTATTGTSNGDIARSPYRGAALLDTLEANTSYTYQVLANDGSTSSAYTFKTGAFGLGSGFEFAAFGDPQIGADSNNNSQSSSADLKEDAAGWADTLNVLQADATDDALPLELLTSTGDQIETANVESQWDAWFTPDQLRTLPYAAAIGNHDSSDSGYKYHFALPNNDTTTPELQTAAGGDYWYVYKGVLFVVINSNAQSSVKDPAHMAFVTKAVKANPGAKWRVVSYHHAIYSPASHADDADNIARRPTYTQSLSDLGINLVLQGHDHSYSRSYVLQNKGSGPDRQNAAEAQGANNVVEGPGGVVYVTTNSASGSKYYPLKEPLATGTSDATHLGKYAASTMPWGPAAGGTHTLHWANSVENQDNVRTYLKVAVTADKLSVTNVVAGVCDYPNKFTTQHIGTWCGASQTTTSLVDTNGNTTFDRNQGSTGAPAQPTNVGADKYTTTTGVAPVGTAQDSVNIAKWDGTQGDGQLLALDVPPSNPGELGWFVNGGNHLINLGTANRHGNYFTASGPIDPLTVSDTRAFGDTSWSLNAQVSDLKDGAATLPAKYVGWQPMIVTPGAGASAGGAVANGYSSGNGLADSHTLASAANGHPTGTAQVGASLSLKFPVSVSADTAHNFWGEITYTLL